MTTSRVREATGRLLLGIALLGVPAWSLGNSRPASAALAECPQSVAIAAEAIRAELVCLLQTYLRIDTTNPPGNEIHAARFLQRVLERDAIASQIIESAPGRANLYARLPGTGEAKALVVMHHMDVVPATADDWSVPPFSGELRDGALWGRGSLDNKGMGVAGLVAFLMLHRSGIELPRDVILLAVADEEAGGGFGARWLLEHRADLFRDVGFILNEGGAIVPGGAERFLYSVELAQKAPLWLRVTANGPSGHGSSPRPDAAPHVLVRALARLEAHRFPITVLPEVQQVFAARAQSMPEDARAPYLNLATSLHGKAFRQKFLENPRQATLVRHSLAITMLTGSQKENVVPARASAILDLRILPGHDPSEVRDEVLRVMAEPNLEVETLLSWQGFAAPRDTVLFRAIERLAADRHPGSTVTANFIAGFTDCNAFRAKGFTCYGFVPMVLTPEDFPGIHGRDERIEVERLVDATIALFELIRSIPVR